MISTPTPFYLCLYGEHVGTYYKGRAIRKHVYGQMRTVDA